MATGQSLTGKLLVAMPQMRDANFGEALVYVCKHGAEGAFGLIINKPAPLMSFADLVDKIELEGNARDIPDDVLRIPVHFGGPVEQFRGFVLHSTDYKTDDMSLKIGRKYALTATIDILRHIAEEKGPARNMIALGYSGWSPGQLENEIMHNGWLHCEPDDELLFSEDLQGKYKRAMNKIGVDPRMMSTAVGHG